MDAPLLVKNRTAFVFGLVALMVFLAYRLVLGGNNVLLNHDNLDDIVPNIVSAIDSGYPWAPNSLVNNAFGNRVPVTDLAEGNYLVEAWFLVLPPLFAYLLNDSLVRLVGFLGMFLLAGLFLPAKPWLRVLFGWVWALLPVYSIYGLSVLGQPLLLYCLWQLLSPGKERVWHWVFWLIFPLYSYFALTGVYILVFMTVAWVAIAVWYKSLFRRFGILLLLLGTVYVVANANLVLRTLDPTVPSHRVEYAIPQGSDFLGTVSDTFRIFWEGKYHVASFPNFVGVVALVLALVLAFFPRGRRPYYTMALVSLGVALAILLWFAIYNSLLFDDLRRLIPLLNQFQWERFYFLLPLTFAVAFLALAAEVDALWTRLTTTLGIGALLLVQLALTITSSGEWRGLWKHHPADALFSEGANLGMTWNQYYSKSLFDKIHERLGPDSSQYRVISVGLAPAIAQMNGFWNLDGYSSLYTLEYKHLFEKVIAPELDRSPRWTNYFRTWGNRCYVFSSELDGFYYPKARQTTIKTLMLNLPALKAITDKPVFLFSAVEILDSRQSGWELVDTWTSGESPWKVRVYQIASE